MRDGWENTPLRRVTRQVIEPVALAPDCEYTNLGVKWYAAGTFQRKPKLGSDIKATRLFRVRPGQFVYNRLFATEGSFALVRPADAHAVASNEFPVFAVDAARLLPEYLYLHFQQPSVWQDVNLQCTGTTKSRLRWKEDRFGAYQLALPPLAEQRRIVDLIGALDGVAGALADATNAAQETRGFLLEALLARLPEATALKPIGSVGVFLRGRRFTKSDYVDEGLGCIHYGQIHTDLGSVTTHPLTFVPEEMRGRLRLASPGDVVVAATSEDVEGLGKATAWLGKDDVAVHDDCYIFRHSLDPRFASHLFASKGFQRQKVQFAAGTKVTRISGANLGLIEVPVPHLADQAVIGQTMSDLDATLDSLTLERSRLRSLRAHALAVLLSGEHEIPESYDEFLGVAS